MVPQLVKASIESAIASRSMIVPSCLCVPMRGFYLVVTTRVKPSRWPVVGYFDCGAPLLRAGF